MTKDSTSVKQHLFSLTNRGIKYDLERIRNAAQHCGNPQLTYKSFHIAGTNGKGSTCTYIDSVLRQCGYTTGLYTSPHIVSFEERFLVNGRPINEEEWFEVYKYQEKIIEEYNLTFFEATTLMAFEIFKRNNVDYAVFETGMGGRLDATNILIPQVSVITHIAMDHMEYLGSTILDIAKEKLGIIKNTVPVIFASNEYAEVNDAAKKTADEKNSALKIISPDDAQLISNDYNGLKFIWDNYEYTVQLRGKFQLTNALLALNALQTAGITDYNAVSRGLANAALPGRFQIFYKGDKTIVFDVGHNPDAAMVLVDTLKGIFGQRKICFITGIMKDKDTKNVLRIYSTIANSIILCKPAIERAADPQTLINEIDKSFVQKCEIHDSVIGAVNAGLNHIEDVICISGSFYTVGEAFIALGIQPFKESA